QLVLVLLAAALISFVLAALETDEKEKSTAFVEPIVILLILIANATVGVIQESNAEKAIEALKEYSPDEAKVVREAVLQKVHAVDLVPGDVVHLAVGDKVPADCRLVTILSSSFRVDQAILTGESVSVSKEPDVVLKDTRAVKQDQINILFSGTTITIGKAIAVVVQTGTSTAIGDIHKSITSQISEKTPLKQALDDFGEQLARIISVICILVWVINVRHFTDDSFGGNWVKGAVYYFKIAVALAVAAIPEGLAVVITTCLALGTKKMAAQGAIVRKLRSVETLGCTSVICSDKTGTLTTNQMSVRRVLTMDSPNDFHELSVSGSTYGPEGLVFVVSHTAHTKIPADRNILVQKPVLNELAHICALCNDSRIVYDENADAFSKLGEPTEAALKALVEKLGTDSSSFNSQIPVIPDISTLHTMSPKDKLWRAGQCSENIEARYKKLSTFEFSRDRKSMSVLVERLEGAPIFSSPAPSKPVVAKNTHGGQTLFVKGAPEAIIERCTHVRTESGVVAFGEELKKKVLARVGLWADEESLRVLGFATVDVPRVPGKVDVTDYAKIEVCYLFCASLRVSFIA
ncbi:hypothetical protein HK102_008760, partial [Quaeritorhiza haematococci]